MTLEQFKEKVPTFLDVDGVECCRLGDIIDQFGSFIALDDLYQKSWELEDANGTYDSISVFDARLIIMLSEMGENLKDVEYTECKECSVCNSILLPDDECYVDVDSKHMLCDVHSMFDEVKSGYVVSY
jgi:hypothetical protein